MARIPGPDVRHDADHSLVCTEVPAAFGEVKFDSGVFARQDVYEEEVGAGPAGKNGDDGKDEKQAKHVRPFQGMKCGWSFDQLFRTTQRLIDVARTSQIP